MQKPMQTTTESTRRPSNRPCDAFAQKNPTLDYDEYQGMSLTRRPAKPISETFEFSFACTQLPPAWAWHSRRLPLTHPPHHDLH